MRVLGFIAGFLLLLSVPVTSYAIGLEVAVGGWQQEPSGDISYKLVSTTDTLDLEKDLKYDKETQVFGRLKIDMPGIIPNIYLMATPMEFDGTGKKDVSFKFGDKTFTQNVDFYSKVTLDHYDIALYYGLPFIETATTGKLNIELGLNARIIDFEATVRQDATGLSETKSITLAVPMVYVGVQLRPMDSLTIEGEARGIAYSGNHYYDFIGRVKIYPMGPLFIAAGWRAEDIKIDEEDVKADVDFSGPFIEAGIQF
jgi:outer membrane protein